MSAAIGQLDRLAILHCVASPAAQLHWLHGGGHPLLEPAALLPTVSDSQQLTGRAGTHKDSLAALKTGSAPATSCLAQLEAGTIHGEIRIAQVLLRHWVWVVATSDGEQAAVGWSRISTLCC